VGKLFLCGSCGVDPTNTGALLIVTVVAWLICTAFAITVRSVIKWCAYATIKRVAGICCLTRAPSTKALVTACTSMPR
jgi:hypothetical protein